MSEANSSLTIRVGTSGVAAAMSEIKALGEVIKGLAAPIAALTSLAGFTELAKGGMSFAGQAARMKQVIGGTIQDMAGLSYASEHTGVSIDSLQSGLKKFSEYLVKTGQGHKSMKEALLEESAIFQSMPNGVEKSARAVALFGRSGNQMIPLLNQGPEALEKLFDRGNELSGVTDSMALNAKEFNHSLADLKMASEGLAATLASGLLPPMTHLIERATDGIVKFREWTQQSQTFKMAVDVLASAITALAAVKIGQMISGGLAAFVGAGAITGIRDFIAALQLLPAAFMAAAASVAPLTIGIIGLTGLIWIGVEGWKLWKAKQQEALSEKGAVNAMNNLAESIRKNIEAQTKAGTVTVAQGNQMRERVVLITDEWKRGTITLEDYRKKLDEIAVKLQSTNPVHPANDAPTGEVFITPEILEAYKKSAESLRALELARREADAATVKASIETQEKQLEDSYRRRLISIQDYYAKKMELERRAAESAKAPKFYQLDNIDGQVADLEQKKAATDSHDLAAIATLDAQRNALLAERVKIVSEIVQIDERQKALEIDEAGKSQQEIQKLILQGMEEQSKDRLLKLDEQLASVEGNYLLSNVEKYQQKKKLLQDQATALQAYIVSLRLLSKFQDPATAQVTQGRADSAEKQLSQTNHAIGSLGPDPASFKAQFGGVLTDLKNQWGTWATQTAGAFKSVFNSAVSSISNGITGLIMGTMTWGQALRQIGSTILNEIISSIVQMGVRWVLTQIMMHTIGSALAAASTATIAPIAAAQVAIWTAPATLATIASYGGAALAAPGLIAYANAMTFTESLAGFAQGGFTGTGGNNEVAGIVHRNEFVMPASAVNRIGLPTLEAMKAGTATGNATTVEGHKVNLHFYDDRPHPKDFLASSEGENMIVNIARKNRVKIGIGT